MGDKIAKVGFAKMFGGSEKGSDAKKKEQVEPKPLDLARQAAKNEVTKAKSFQDKAKESNVKISSDASKNSETPAHFKYIKGNTELANAQRDQKQKKEVQESSSKRQLSYAEAGLMRLHKIYDTRPTDIKKHNSDTLVNFEERYKIIIDHSPITRSCHSYTYAKESKGIYPQYRAELDANGNFSVKAAWKHWPGGSPNPSTPCDNEIKVGETSSLYHSQIMYNELCYMQDFLKTKNNCSEVDLESLKDSVIYNPNTKSMIDHYLKDDEKEKTFSRGELGYIATVGTDLGIGKWYLIKHHYKNKEIVAVTLQRGIDKDKADAGIYNIIYHIGNKSY